MTTITADKPAQKTGGPADVSGGWFDAGTSFVVGAGPVFPHCMQSEIANLAGSLTGRGDNVVAWPSVEPAADYTANSLPAFALGADQGSGLG